MDCKLPKFIAISIGKHYASVLTKPDPLRDYVGAKENNDTPVPKIEVEPAGSECVHLRFCSNKKYLVRLGEGTDKLWLVASAGQPEKDKSKLSCTLFQPKFLSKDKEELYLIHVQTGKYVQLKSPSEYKKDCFYLDDSPYKLRYKDWNSLVMLPKCVAFKGSNGKYLRCRLIENRQSLEFSSKEKKEKATAFEVTGNPDGYLHIKSMDSGKYMRLTDKLIYADSGDFKSDICTRFHAVKSEDKTIALCAHNGKLCKRYTEGQYTDCFAAAGTHIDVDSLQQVEEVDPEKNKARIPDEKTIVPGEGSAKNKSQEKTTTTVKSTLGGK